MTAHPTAALLF